MKTTTHTFNFPLRRLALALSLSLAAVPVHAAPGDALGPAFQVNTFTADDQDFPTVAANAGGNFVVAWESVGQDGNGFGIYAQRYAADGMPLGGEFQVNGTTASEQRNPAVALDVDGDFVIAWQSADQDGNRYGVYAQRYSADGMPQGTEFQVNNTFLDHQHKPSVALDADGDFVIAWESYPDIYARRYAANGAPRGSEFRVNTSAPAIHSRPDVAIDADGDFVVAWETYRFGNDIYAQRYAANGMPQGGEFRVNTITARSQRSASVALDADGDFVITWHGVNPAGDRYDVYARRYTADGTPQDSEFQLNTLTAVLQFFPSIATGADGDFVVTWNSQAFPPGSDNGIYARRYAADGTAQGNEFLIDPSPNFSSVASDADGDFVVTWNRFGQSGDGDGSGVFARRFEGEPTDSDGDGVLDSADNCTHKTDPTQRDSNGDGFGNVCDPDLDGNGVVNTADLALMRQRFYTPNADADFNGDGVVNFADLAILKSLFNQPPGPSGVVAP